MNRLLLILITSTASLAAAVLAQTTQPAISVDLPPTTQPAASVEGQSVLIAPISPLPGNSWFARAFQEDIATDLSQMSRLRVLAPDMPPPASSEEALRNAREAGATYVIYGQARPTGNSMQVTGQVLEVGTGRSLATLDSSAPADDLFPLEDTIALQAAQVLPGSLVTRSAAAATQPAGQDNGPPYISELNPSGPNVPGQSAYPGAGETYSGAPPADYYTYGPDYSGAYYDPYYYPYYYPYWGYGWGATIVFVPGYGWCHYHPGWYHGYGWYRGPYWGHRGYYYGPRYYGPRYYGRFGYRGPVGRGYGGYRGGGHAGGGMHGGGERR